MARNCTRACSRRVLDSGLRSTAARWPPRTMVRVRAHPDGLGLPLSLTQASARRPRCTSRPIGQERWTVALRQRSSLRSSRPHRVALCPSPRSASHRSPSPYRHLTPTSQPSSRRRRRRQRVPTHPTYRSAHRLSTGRAGCRTCGANRAAGCRARQERRAWRGCPPATSPAPRRGRG